MSPASVEHYNDVQQRGALRVLEILDRLDARLATHYSTLRRHPRRPFRGTATVRLVTGQGDGPQELRVWTRSLSESGLSFICPKSLAGRRLQIGLELTPGQSVWLEAEVVRCREVAGEGFWDHGVAFRGRVAPEQDRDAPTA